MGLVRHLSDDTPRNLARRMIREMIISGGYGQGDKLPPYRTLCERLGVSVVTLQRAMNDLANEGVVYRLRGSGTYVTHAFSRPKGHMKDVVLITSFSRHLLASMPYLNQIVSGLLLECEQLHCALEILSFQTSGTRLAAHEIAQRADGVVLLGIPNKVYVRTFASETIATVIVDSPMDNVVADFVVCDNTAAVEGVMHHLFMLGHRRIAFVGSMTIDKLGDAGRGCAVEALDTVERREAYYRCMRRHGTAGAARAWCLSPHQGAPESADAVVEVVANVLSETPKPTAIVADGMGSALSVYNALARLAVHVPADISLAAAAGATGEGRVEQQTISYSCVDFQSMGVRAMETLEARHAGKRLMRAKMTRIPSRFAPGSTTAPPTE